MLPQWLFDVIPAHAAEPVHGVTGYSGPPRPENGIGIDRDGVQVMPVLLTFDEARDPAGMCRPPYRSGEVPGLCLTFADRSGEVIKHVRLTAEIADRVADLSGDRVRTLKYINDLFPNL